MLTHLASSKLGRSVSTYTVAKLLNSDLWTGIVPKALPINNDQQKKQRKEWCDANLDHGFGRPGGRGSAALYIDIDEKYFESWQSRLRYFSSQSSPCCLTLRYVPTDLVTDSTKFTHHASKTQKNKVMMFAAVYRPRPDINDSLDGKLMLKVAHRQKVPFPHLCLSISLPRHKRTSPNSQVRVCFLHFASLLLLLVLVVLVVLLLVLLPLSSSSLPHPFFLISSRHDCI